MNSNTRKTLSVAMIMFHWLIGLGMIAVLILGLVMDDEPNNILFNAHVSFGLLLLAFSIPRLIARLTSGMPSPVTERSRFEAIAAKIVMYSLLALTVILPLSGIAVSIGQGYGLDFFGLPLISPGNEMAQLEDLAEGIHELAGETILPLLLLLHVSATMLHHFVHKDATLLRMLGRS